MAEGAGKTLDDGELVPLEVKTGDKVLFGKYSGSELSIQTPVISSLPEYIGTDRPTSVRYIRDREIEPTSR